MKWGRTKVYTQSKVRRPFWNCVTSLETIKGVVFFHFCCTSDSSKKFQSRMTIIMGRHSVVHVYSSSCMEQLLLGLLLNALNYLFINAILEIGIYSIMCNVFFLQRYCQQSNHCHISNVEHAHHDFLQIIWRLSWPWLFPLRLSFSLGTCIISWRSGQQKWLLFCVSFC